jgi:hypothetical protein
VESQSGIVAGIDRDQVFVTNGSGGLTLKMKGTVRIWKGEDGVPVSAIRLGNDLVMRGERDSDGTFVPSEIWVNITALDGIVKRIEGSAFTVEVVRNDSVPQVRTVKVTSKTVSGGEAPFKREQLQVGRLVRVIGLALEDGTVQASRITVYVKGRPIGSEGSKVMDPTGKIRERR